MKWWEKQQRSKSAVGMYALVGGFLREGFALGWGG